MSVKAYPTAWAEEAALREAAGRWQRLGWLAAPQRAAIEAAYPQQYYRPGNWLRLGLLLATGFGISSAGISTTLTLGLNSYLVASLLLLAGAGGLLEIIIRKSKHYYSGVDNALLYAALGAWAVFWTELLDKLHITSASTPLTVWALAGPSLLVLLLAVVRYADPLVAATAYVTAGVLLVVTVLATALGILLLPFALALAAGAVLLLLRRLAQRADFLYYRSALVVLRTLALVTLYLAGNYFILLELLTKSDGPGFPTWAVALFWVPTVLVPLLYIALGLRRADRLLLGLGLLGLAVSAYTFRLHHAVLPPAVAATLAGALLTGLALGLLRYLRTVRHGLTAAADAEVRPLVNLESFVQLETASVPGPPVPGFEFGGGGSGGGGAQGQF